MTGEVEEVTPDPADSVGDAPMVPDTELARLARDYRYGEFRRYTAVDMASQRTYTEKSIRHELKIASRTAVVHRGERLRGIGMLKASTWESEFFHLPMASLDIRIGSEHRMDTARQLMGQLLGDPLPYRVLTLQVDGDDFETRLAAEECGFRLMDTVCTYEFHAGSSPFPDSIERNYGIRPYRPEDRPAVVRIASKCFREYPSRFALNPLIGAAGAQAMYVRWAERCCSGELATEMRVAELRGRVVGFLAWRINRELLEYTGIVVRGQGLGGCLPVRFNAYRELLWISGQDCGRPPADFDTHLTNLATIRAYQSLGFLPVRIRYNLHRWH